MIRTGRKAVRNTVAYLMTIFFLMASVAGFSSGQTKQTQSDENPPLKLGQLDPDSELPKLTLKTDNAGEPVGVISEKDTV